MSLTNIVDCRTKKYAFANVTAIVEPTCHDNSCTGADWAGKPEIDWSYDELKSCSVNEAIVWAGKKSGPTTLYIYDLGDGISVQRSEPDGADKSSVG